MRQRLVIIGTVVIALGLLILLNALSYAKPTEQAESELTPNRSTYHVGATGTRAFFDLLNESGYRVTRWREPAGKLAGESGSRISTFVMIGSMLRPPSKEEAASILHWVKRGGRLVIIDRAPELKLLGMPENWNIYVEPTSFPDLVLDPSDTERMTEGSSAVTPEIPTLLTRDVRSIRPSRFAASIKISHPLKVSEKGEAKPTPEGSVFSAEPDSEEDQPRPNRGPVVVVKDTAAGAATNQFSPAPVVHASTSKGALLIDYAYGTGRIVLLSDPYIVANNGIKLDDNLQLAVNTLTERKGLIAFDEFHQGHSASGNALATYFAGTPILAICGQLMLVVLAVVWSRGRRFARPLPPIKVDRRSSLEFVASMAELQQRSRAYDLALENIYARTRRALTRYAGVDYNSPRSEIAERISSRSTLAREQVEALMRECEDAINGEPLSERKSIDLVRQLRQLERALGLRMRSRDARQAAENI